MNQTPSEMHQRITVITNKKANRGRAAAKGTKVTDLLRSYGCEVEHHQPAGIDETKQVARDAINEERHLIAVGGDGLLHHLTQVCAETHATLGIVAAGTGNDFAFGLDLPVGLRASTRAALTPTQGIDLLKFEDANRPACYGATIATAGFSAVVNVRAEKMSWPRGSTRYTVATLRELAKLKRYDFELNVDGVETEGRCLMIAIANTRAFGGGMQIAPQASPHDGNAEIVLIRDTSAFNLLRMLPKTFSGGHTEHPAVEISRGTKISVALRHHDSRENCRLRSDGEDVGSLPQTVTVVSGGLRVAGLSPLAPNAEEAAEEDE
tara:strand:+ start:3890 stop:4855 length:966 start_codon:yes stop_codon:yes gene_type:complete